MKHEDVRSGGLIARPLLLTSESPSNMEKVPSVTMIEGSRRLIASSPFTRPRIAPKAIPATIASQGLRPATINRAATTAEKLNIHPTDRSISRIASR